MRGGSVRPPSSTGPAALKAIVKTPTSEDERPDRAHRFHSPHEADRAGGDHRHAGGRDREQGERDRCAGDGRNHRAPVDELRCEQSEEERRERSVEAELLGIAEHVAGQCAERGAADPERKEDEARADEHLPVDSSSADLRHGPRLVDDQLRLEQAP